MIFVLIVMFILAITALSVLTVVVLVLMASLLLLRISAGIRVYMLTVFTFPLISILGIVFIAAILFAVEDGSEDIILLYFM